MRFVAIILFKHCNFLKIGLKTYSERVDFFHRSARLLLTGKSYTYSTTIRAIDNRFRFLVEMLPV